MRMSRPPNFSSAVETNLAQSEALVTLAVTVETCEALEEEGGYCFD